MLARVGWRTWAIYTYYVQRYWQSCWLKIHQNTTSLPGHEFCKQPWHLDSLLCGTSETCMQFFQEYCLVSARDSNTQAFQHYVIHSFSITILWSLVIFTGDPTSTYLEYVKKISCKTLQLNLVQGSLRLITTLDLRVCGIRASCVHLELLLQIHFG